MPPCRRPRQMAAVPVRAFPCALSTARRVRETRGRRTRTARVASWHVHSSPHPPFSERDLSDPSRYWTDESVDHFIALGMSLRGAQDINDSLVRGSWRRLVYGQHATADGTVDRNAYVFCVLTQFHRHLKRHDVYAPRSSRWRDPRAQLLSGEAWENAKGPVLQALGLPEDPTKLIDSHARSLDAAYRQVASRIDAGTEVTVDDQGRLHLSALEAIPDPPSLIGLRKLVGVMLPRIGLPEVIVEVMSWLPGFVGAFTSVSDGRTRLEDLDVSIAACLSAHAMNIDFTELVKRGVPALERGRLSHVNQNYLGA
jgi:Tn3 transposase DDE domain